MVFNQISDRQNPDLHHLSLQIKSASKTISLNEATGVMDLVAIPAFIPSFFIIVMSVQMLMFLYAVKHQHLLHETVQRIVWFYNHEMNIQRLFGMFLIAFIIEIQMKCLVKYMIHNIHETNQHYFYLSLPHHYLIGRKSAERIDGAIRCMMWNVLIKANQYP